jgi:glycosyltransferase involved in cell wall biosynthesis
LNTPSRAERILLLTASLAPGGAETVIVQLAKAVRAGGAEVSVVSMLPPTAFTGELESSGVPVVSLEMKGRRLNIIAIFRFFKYLHRFQPNLIHGHMFHASILARLARAVTGIPVVCTVHNEIESSRRKRSAHFREWIYRVTDALCVRTTAVSERVRQRYVREGIVPAGRIEVIGNGVDPERFQPCPEQRQRTRAAYGWLDSFIWLAVGRLELAKDYPNLIQAFHRVHEHSPASRLVIVGEGRLRTQIEGLITRAGLQEAVSLLGLRTDVPDLVNACDALVVSSAWEGGPIVLLEAGAAGRPVVATEVGAAPEIVVRGQTGFLVPVRDPHALGKAMTELMELEPDERAHMGREARRYVMDRFSLRSVHDRYKRLYSEVLAAST